ncbi:MAG TPA: hypothetical protein DCL61_22205 [Cyanobacteria bacterium UBA12227]|nr:hypothetical protein [Cyanobacteria bacterium UBA12227]HAX86495.1 hypothetical protein [Cyanobacteria bacterium UBA11370]
MTQITHRRVPLGRPIFPNRPPLSPQEIARRKAEKEAFAQRCQVIFDQVYPELVTSHYNWFITIEPESGEYFIDPDKEVAFQKARQKHPNTKIMVMGLNSKGTCGRI